MKKQLIAGMAIALTLASCVKDESENLTTTGSETGSGTVTATTESEAQAKLIEQLQTYAPSEQTKTVDANSVINLTTEEGNIITFPSDAFVDAAGNPVKGDVDISVTEITNISDVILSGMMTNSDEGPLSSQGEFKIEVTQDGKEVFLDDNTTFTIDNPTAEVDTGMVGWHWVEEGKMRTSSASTAGEWIQNGIKENNPCKIYKKLAGDVADLEPGTAAESWPTIKAFSDFVLTEVEKEVDLSSLVSETIESYWGSGYNDFIYINNETKEWQLLDEWSLVAEGSGASEIDTFITADTSQIWVSEPNECVINIVGRTSINLDPNVVQIRFNELNWCNIDRLLAEYGTLHNCTFNSDIPDFAKVVCVFKEFNGAVNCRLNSDGKFYADRLPDGLEVQFLIYYMDGDKIRCGTQMITPSKEMEFDPANLITLDNVDELAEMIKNLTE